MFTQKTVINRLKKLAVEIKESGIHLNRIVLFGSYSRNEQHRWSDIDVVLVADEFKGIGFEDVHLLSKVLRKYDRMNLQPQTYNTKDFSADKDPFIREILRTGIEI
jgi:predicted nucleotidyltransferase